MTASRTCMATLCNVVRPDLDFRLLMLQVHVRMNGDVPGSRDAACKSMATATVNKHHHPWHTVLITATFSSCCLQANRLNKRIAEWDNDDTFSKRQVPPHLKRQRASLLVGTTLMASSTALLTATTLG